MALGHERRDVYRLAIGYVAWVYGKAATLEGVHRAARDQWLRASQSIPLNIAEGNGKQAPTPSADILDAGVLPDHFGSATDRQRQILMARRSDISV